MEQQTLAGVFVLGLLLTNQCAQPTVGALTITIQQADLVLLNGKVITVDSEDTIVEAVAVKNGRIDKLGKNEFVKTFVGPQTLVLDLKGKTVTPGLVDSHIHVMYHGRQFWEGFLNIRFPDVRSKKDLLRLVAERIKTTAKGEWISGNQGFPLSMKETPNRWELDLVSPNNPVYLRHSSGQYGTVNSYALRLAGDVTDSFGETGSEGYGVARSLVARMVARSIARRARNVNVQRLGYWGGKAAATYFGLGAVYQLLHTLPNLRALLFQFEHCSH